MTAVSEISRHEKKSKVSKLLIALIVKRNSAFMTGISKMSTHVETKSIESKLLVALIVIRNSAFFRLLDLLILNLGIPGNLVRGLVDAQGAWYGPGMLKGLPG